MSTNAPTLFDSFFDDDNESSKPESSTPKKKKKSEEKSNPSPTAQLLDLFAFESVTPDPELDNQHLTIVDAPTVQDEVTTAKPFVIEFDEEINVGNDIDIVSSAGFENVDVEIDSLTEEPEGETTFVIDENENNDLNGLEEDVVLLNTSENDAFDANDEIYEEEVIVKDEVSEDENESLDSGDDMVASEQGDDVFQSILASAIQKSEHLSLEPEPEEEQQVIEIKSDANAPISTNTDVEVSAPKDMSDLDQIMRVALPYQFLAEPLPSFTEEKSIVFDSKPIVPPSKKKVEIPEVVEPVADEKIELEDWNLDKNYYTIGNVAKMFDVNISHIRFWTNEFNLKPRTNKKGDRLYTPDNIKTLQLIHHLVKVQHHTIKGAKEKLKNRKVAVEAGKSLKDYLVSLKSTLEDLRNQID